MPTSAPAAPTVRRNDPAQYDELAAEWWAPRGRFAMLHWIAAARAARIPSPGRPGALLLDAGCGGGLLAPYLRGSGYRHLGVDLSTTALMIARERGLCVARADVGRLPLADAAADVVVAGELLEHVPNLPEVVAEVARVLRPGGVLVLDTIASTWFGRFTAITVGERVPAGPPKLLHDPALFVDRRKLRRECERHNVSLRLTGLRPSLIDYLAWLLGRRSDVRMLPTRVTAGLFQAVGTKGRPR